MFFEGGTKSLRKTQGLFENRETALFANNAPAREKAQRPLPDAAYLEHSALVLAKTNGDFTFSKAPGEIKL